MTYMLLIVEPLGQRTERGLQAGQQAYAEMQRFGQALQERGVLLGSQALTSAATRVQRRADRVQALDGPFAETKEMVGGYFLLDCATREQALEIAAECPAAAWAAVEVREIGTCYE
jgi:hypothetical protein